MRTLKTLKNVVKKCYNIYDGTKLPKIREFSEYQASGSPHWQQAQII